MEIDIKIPFGKKVREIRLKRQLTQLDLATKLKTEPSQVGRIERAEISTSVSYAGKIANALEVPVKDLFDFD
ncbi:helix-turn-helix transcriptional regulator [Fulvivirgaceae bacterium BMA12]|uniref:Helix-turn-helix transcriptional regulator n=1 Tax=Agaribacillus aureus TaxID=3051825 RepID=A0ABT8L9V8_9BACT|nr:helix-turn-helix transcriptional regulator [Fulvivirgaceae bacterium BMA12]